MKTKKINAKFFKILGKKNKKAYFLNLRVKKIFLDKTSKRKMTSKFYSVKIKNFCLYKNVIRRMK